MVSLPKELSLRRKEFQRELLVWYEKHGRIFPWRTGKTRWGRDPYRVLVSEVMLQQTQVDRVVPYYLRWMKRWPTAKHLVHARRASVIKAWAGLGYNRRAVYLHKAARQVFSSYGGEFPRNEDDLMKLPGVGKYTARAVLAFAYGEDVGVLETNTKRVLLRFFLWGSSSRFSENELLLLSDQVVPKGKGDEWNQALMDFGAMVCTAKKPKCEECPLRKMCLWYQNQTQNAKLKAQNHNSKLKTFRKKREKFEETDRYFRGRIVDALRDRSFLKTELSRLMKSRYHLVDQARLERLVRQLKGDGLLVTRDSTVSLP